MPGVPGVHDRVVGRRVAVAALDHELADAALRADVAARARVGPRLAARLAAASSAAGHRRRRAPPRPMQHHREDGDDQRDARAASSWRRVGITSARRRPGGHLMASRSGLVGPREAAPASWCRRPACCPGPRARRGPVAVRRRRGRRVRGTRPTRSSGAVVPVAGRRCPCTAPGPRGRSGALVANVLSEKQLSERVGGDPRSQVERAHGEVGERPSRSTTLPTTGSRSGCHSTRTVEDPLEPSAVWPRWDRRAPRVVGAGRVPLARLGRARSLASSSGNGTRPMPVRSWS